MSKLDLGDGYWYHNEADWSIINQDQIAKIEENYQMKFVAEWPLIKNENRPVLLFWSETPHPRGSQYMGMYFADNTWWVCDGITATNMPINCVVSNDKQVLYSKSHHDFRSSEDESVRVDGGRSYTRILGNVHCEKVWVVPQDGELKIIPETMALLMKEKNK